nr:hypothetical protein [uncultured Dongia sp.]
MKVVTAILLVMLLAWICPGARGKSIDKVDGGAALCISHDAVIAEIRAAKVNASMVVVMGGEARRLLNKINGELVWGPRKPYVGNYAIISTPSQAEGLARADLFDGGCATVTIFAPTEWFKRWIGEGV